MDYFITFSASAVAREGHRGVPCAGPELDFPLYFPSARNCGKAPGVLLALALAYDQVGIGAVLRPSPPIKTPAARLSLKKNGK